MVKGVFCSHLNFINLVNFCLRRQFRMGLNQILFESHLLLYIRATDSRTLCLSVPMCVCVWCVLFHGALKGVFVLVSPCLCSRCYLWCCLYGHFWLSYATTCLPTVSPSPTTHYYSPAYTVSPTPTIHYCSPAYTVSPSPATHCSPAYTASPSPTTYYMPAYTVSPSNATHY